MRATLSVPDALVAVMFTTSAADERLSDIELMSITRMVEHLPAFDGYEHARIREVSQMVFEILEAEEGLDAILGLVRDSLPEGFNETAYAMACDVAAADRTVRMAELRWLQLLREGLSVGGLAAAAIERAARARHMRLPAAD